MDEESSADVQGQAGHERAEIDEWWVIGFLRIESTLDEEVSRVEEDQDEQLEEVLFVWRWRGFFSS
jgi:hypothetical protein